MDNTEDDARYHSANPYGVTQGYGSSQRPKLPVQSSSYPQKIGNQYVDDNDVDDDEEDEEVEVEEEEEDNNEDNGNREIVKVENDDDDIVDDDDSDDENEGEDENEHNGYSRKIGEDDLEKHQKKRKLKSLLSYEFAPRLAASASASASKPSFGRRNSLADWTEQETFILLDAWGERFLKRGRKSLRSEEWQEVAEKVTKESKGERTDTQCRNRLDTLKKKYKKEKGKVDESKGMTCKWVYFNKMDMLMSSSPKQPGLSCGVDSGEYVFMNPKAYLNRSNGLDEMRDSPRNSESAKGEKDDSDGLPPKRVRTGKERDDGASFRLLADSIEKFSELYEKIENSKRQQMVELEKMRMDFHRELELHKRQILERARAEIAKIRLGDNEENDLSTENVSG